jgi:hypothetical protein
MDLEMLFKKSKCCISERPLADCKAVNIIQLDYIATWKYPKMGNILIPGDYNHASAFIHDNYAPQKAGDKIAPIKFAIEFQNDTVIYHPVESLQKGPLLFLRPTRLWLTSVQKEDIRTRFYQTTELYFGAPGDKRTPFSRELLTETLQVANLQFMETNEGTNIVIWIKTQDQQAVATYLMGKIMHGSYSQEKVARN